MAFVIICRDAPDSREKRPGVRGEHLKYWQPLNEAGKIILAGPLTDFAGSMFVLDVASAGEARELVANDPYTRAGIFETVEIHPFKCVLGPLGER